MFLCKCELVNGFVVMHTFPVKTPAITDNMIFFVFLTLEMDALFYTIFPHLIISRLKNRLVQPHTTLH